METDERRNFAANCKASLEEFLFSFFCSATTPLIQSYLEDDTLIELLALSLLWKWNGKFKVKISGACVLPSPAREIPLWRFKGGSEALWRMWLGH